MKGPTELPRNSADTVPAVDVVEVLTAHERAPGYRDLHVHCRCGWEGPRLSGDVEHRAHVAAAVVAALAPSHTEAVRAALDAVDRRADEGIEFGPTNYLLLRRILADVRRELLADTATTTGADT